MSTETLPPGAEPLPPWVDKERNGCLAGLLILAFVILIMVAIGGLITTLMFLTDTSMFSNSGIWGFVIAIVVLGLSIVGMIFLFPQLKVPAAFKSHYIGPSNTLGIPFEVRFQGGKQRMLPVGTVWFGDAALRVTGTQEAGACTYLFWGWLWASMFRKQVMRDMAYQYVTLVSVIGKTVTLSLPTEPPNMFTFRVSLQDGERLYRELCYHFPAQTQQFQALFTKSPSVRPVPSAPAGPMQ